MGFEADSPCVGRVRPSPNHGDRIGGPVDAIVLHYTGMASGRAALERLCDPAAEVSCHYVVERDGLVFQLVPEARRAWHAGRSFWQGERDLNSRSIGVEIVNGGHDFGLPPYPPRQIEAVIALVGEIARRRSIPPSRVLAHSDIAPDRKDDPGERFPWRRLAEAGLCIFVEPAPARDARELGAAAMLRAREVLSLIGYQTSSDTQPDETLRAAIRAFQRRHRPRRIDGRLDRSTLATIERVLSALGGGVSAAAAPGA